MLGVNRLHFSSSIWYMSRNQRSIKKKPSYGVLGVSSLQMPDFPTPILATCLILTSYIQSVIAPKQIDRFWCAWCQLLAFFKLYMIHFKKSKIDQEKAELWGVGFQPPPDAWFSHSNFDHLSTKCHSSQTNWLIFMQLVAFSCIFEALYDSCQ